MDKFCGYEWEQVLKVGTVHHICLEPKDHDQGIDATEHDCDTCKRAGIYFEYDGVRYRPVVEAIAVVDKEVPC